LFDTPSILQQKKRYTYLAGQKQQTFEGNDMTVIPNTSRKRLKIPLKDEDFLTILERPELVTVNPESRTITYNMNQSRLQQYMDCQRRFFWKFVENLDVKKPVLRLELGSGIHESLAVIAAGGQMSEAIDHGIARLFRDYRGIDLMPDEHEELDESAALIRRMMPAYVDHWSDSPWTPLGIEIGGTVDIGNCEIAVRGHDGQYTTQTWTCQITFRLDKLVMFNKQIWIVDHKSAAKLDLRDVQKYAMDVQMTAYTYAATKVLAQQMPPAASGLKPRVQGVIVDMLVKTKEPKFHRDLFYRTDADLIEFQYDWLEWSEQIIRAWLRAAQFEEQGVPGRLAFPKNTKVCFNYGTCPFYGLCTKDTPEGRLEFKQREKDYVDNAGRLPEESGLPEGHDDLPDALTDRAAAEPSGEADVHPTTAGEQPVSGDNP